MPRFPRIQLIHELLWQLVYGQVAEKTSDIMDVDDSKSPAEQSADCEDQVSRNLDDDHEWIKHLKPMPKLNDEAKQPLRGWFRMTDVLLVMPLEILCKTIDVTEEVKHKIMSVINYTNLGLNFTVFLYCLHFLIRLLLRVVCDKIQTA